MLNTGADVHSIRLTLFDDLPDIVNGKPSGQNKGGAFRKALYQGKIPGPGIAARQGTHTALHQKGRSRKMGGLRKKGFAMTEERLDDREPLVPYFFHEGR